MVFLSVSFVLECERMPRDIKSNRLTRDAALSASGEKRKMKSSCGRDLQISRVMNLTINISRRFFGFPFDLRRIWIQVMFDRKPRKEMGKAESFRWAEKSLDVSREKGKGNVALDNGTHLKRHSQTFNPTHV